jgi:hypothetical protein
MKKYLPIAVVSAVIILGLGAYWQTNLRKNNAPKPVQVGSSTLDGHSIDGLPESSKLPNLETNFARAGVITYDNPGQDQNVMYLIYEEPGKPALKKKLQFDAESTCAASNGAIQCIAFNSPLEMAFNGKRATVEGLEMGDLVLVRLLRAVSEDYDTKTLKTGDLILSWPSATKLIESCFVAGTFQSHNLDVGLSLKDGRKVRTVEPVIDEVFKTITRVSSVCGSIPVATE